MNRRLLTAGLVTFLVASMLGVAPASAADQSRSYTLDFTGETSKNLFDVGPYVCDECIPDIFFDDPDRSDEEFGLGGEVSADATLKWVATATDALAYNDSLLRQGQTLDGANTLTTSPGNIHVGLSVAAAFGIYEKHPDLGPDWVQTTATVNRSGEVAGTDIPCAMPLAGESPRVCSGPQETIDVFSVPVAPGVEIVVRLKYKFTVTVSSAGVVSVRKAEILGGQAIGDGPVTWAGSSPDTVHDPVDISCTQPVGNDMTYALTQNTYDADTKFSTVLTPSIGISLEFFPDPDDWDIIDIPIDLLTFPPLHMTAPDTPAQTLGAVQADNLPPVASAGGSGPGHTYAGAEGTAVNFDGTGSSDNCGFPSLRWDFSDGGVAFGPSPSHTFADNGHYTGLLTATDATGNKATQTFEVNISNVAPVANAGPDGSGAWGRPIAFNGAGTDPGSADQSTLVYRWDFGDGSPSATGGPSVVHAYTTPATYTATLTVTDKDGASTSDTRDVVVRKRNTTTSWLGSTTGTYDTANALERLVGRRVRQHGERPVARLQREQCLQGQRQLELERRRDQGLHPERERRDLSDGGELRRRLAVHDVGHQRVDRHRPEGDHDRLHRGADRRTQQGHHAVGPAQGRHRYAARRQDGDLRARSPVGVGHHRRQRRGNNDTEAGAEERLVQPDGGVRPHRCRHRSIRRVGRHEDVQAPDEVIGRAAGATCAGGSAGWRWARGVPVRPPA